MSRTSRLTRPPSLMAGSKLPSPRKECPSVAGRARVVSVGEKLMRAGSNGVLNRQKCLTTSVPQDKDQQKTEIQGPSQNTGEKGQNMEMVTPKSRINPPKTQIQGSVHSKYLTKLLKVIFKKICIMVSLP